MQAPEWSPDQIQALITQLDLPEDLSHDLRLFHTRLAHQLPRLKTDGRPLVLGINGAQGTGKSTLAKIICALCQSAWSWRCVSLSLDDFYLSRAERQVLAEQVHPMLRTRGVPGTHDIQALQSCLHQLQDAGADSRIPIRRFIKALDEPAPASAWDLHRGTVDLVILEGWCVGTPAQTEEQLHTPINALESEQDVDGRWRHYVNQQLAGPYTRIWRQLDALWFLQAPDFEAIVRWRTEQEQGNARPAGDNSQLMSPAQIREFIEYYRRLTLQAYETVPRRADAVLRLDHDHRVLDLQFRDTE